VEVERYERGRGRAYASGAGDEVGGGGRPGVVALDHLVAEGRPHALVAVLVARDVEVHLVPVQQLLERLVTM
jgi:hypothetical protein